MAFSQNNEEVKGESNFNPNIVREEPQRFYEQQDVELINK